jgi:hypothetical protein
MEARHGRPLRQAIAIEYQQRGTSHLHALTYGYRAGSEGAFVAAQLLWQRLSGGIALIAPYQPHGGAATYVTKLVTCDLTPMLLGPWPKFCETP